MGRTQRLQRARASQWRVGMSFIAAFAFIGAIFIIRATAAGNASLSLQISESYIQPNEEVAVQLRLDTDSEPINALQTTLTYDHNVLELVSIIDNPEWDVDLNEESPGKITIVRGVAVSSVNDPDHLVTTITFRGLDTSASTDLDLSNTTIVRITDAVDVFGSATGGTVTVDNVAPSASVTQPTNGQVVGGMTQVQINALDNIAVNRVDIIVDQTVIQTLTSEPYTATLDTVALSDGMHMVGVNVYDLADNVTASPAVSFIVDNTAPNTTLFNPQEAELLSGEVTMKANATDDNGIDRVEFYVGSTQIASDSVGPYSVTWDTAVTGDGTHTVGVRAFDSVGNVAESALHTVVVDNTAPVVTVTTPAEGNTVSNIVNISVNVVDVNEVVRVEMLVDDEVIGTRNAPPYTVDWESYLSEQDQVTITARATDAAGNVGQSAPVSVSVENLSGDLNGDSTVDIIDLSMLLARWQNTEDLGRHDINRDGVINIQDLALLLAEWGQSL